jgi:2-hydroxychromene-2-carboxylate isomerase
MTLSMDVFYSFRSPYCYVLNSRLRKLEVDWDARVVLRPVYPIAIRDRDFFKRTDPLRRAYHILDAAREAEFLGLPYRRPVPDPVVSDLEKDTFAEDQPHIHRLVRLAQAAARNGDGLPFADAVMTLLWDGQTDNWHEGDHLAQTIDGAGLNYAALAATAEHESEALDAEIEANQVDQRGAGHWGVPLMTFDGEPFYGQDHFDQLLWRMKRGGLSARS